ncbi:MAG TPA: DNA topoisomerase [Cellvibrionaceae bacterium]|nr:DNA topoisomerase [Cellvibrionaceae bacterium]
MSILFIVESPKKAKSIAKYFPQFTVLATIGHFRDLPIDRTGVDPDTHRPEYVTMKDKDAVEVKLRAAAKKATAIYLATDPDREGEAIAAHIANCIGNQYKNIMSRVTYQEVNKKAVEQAIAKKRQIDWALVRAQEARRVIDRYVGYLVSPVLTDKFRKIQKIQYLSAGRVQTVALRLIVERHEEIQAFKPTQHWGVLASLEKDAVGFTAKWLPFGFEKNLHDNVEAAKNERLMTDRRLAETVIARTQTLVVAKCDKQLQKIPPPKPLTTTSYLAMVSGRFKLTTKQAMQVAQSLFELGLITYHRTDSPVMSPDFVAEVRAAALKRKLPIPEIARVAQAGANAQEAHECLRVVDIELEQVVLDEPIQEKVYRAIWEVTLASQLDSAVDEVTTVIWHNQYGEKPDYFLSGGNREIKPGFRRLLNYQKDPDDGDDESCAKQRLPALAVSDRLKPLALELQSKVTKAPGVYTEKTLVKKMEVLGIGRPATYASIIETLVSKEYVSRDKGLKFTPLSTGIAIIKAVRQQFHFAEVRYTAEVEKQLDLIAESKAQYLDTVKAIYTRLQNEISRFQAAIFDDELVTFIKGIGVSEAQVSAPAAGKKNAKASTGKSATAGKSSAKSTASPKSNSQSASVSVGANCPTCGSGKLMLRTMSKGDHAGKEFLGCSKFPECRHFGWRH